MKYFVKYEVKKGDKSFIKPGITDFNTSEELNAGQLKTSVKEWLQVPSGETIVSEVLTSGKKELIDTDIIPFSGNTGLSYIMILSGDTNQQSVSQRPKGPFLSGDTKSLDMSKFFKK